MPEATGTQRVQKRLLKTREAAYYLGCSTWTVRRLVQDGRLPYIADRENGGWRFDVRDLDGFIDRNKRSL